MLAVHYDHGDWFIWYIHTRHSPGPCITNVFATRRKSFSQWHRSFQRKLRSHWLKFLRHVAITLVIQGPALLDQALMVRIKKKTPVLMSLWYIHEVVDMPVEKLWIAFCPVICQRYGPTMAYQQLGGDKAILLLIIHCWASLYPTKMNTQHNIVTPIIDWSFTW